MKRILISLSIIGAAAAIAIGATTAFFSDTETSTGNTFTAGSVDLKIYANGNELVGSAPIFTGGQLADIKPGDKGGVLVKLVSDNNDACGYANITLDTDTDNGCNEPEIAAEGATCGTDDGELNDNMNFTLWYDTNGNGIQDAGENDIITAKFVSGMGPISIGELPGGADGKQIGIKWDLPSTVGNDVQTDSFSGTFTVNITQKRNQFPNGCPEAGTTWTNPLN